MKRRNDECLSICLAVLVKNLKVDIFVVINIGFCLETIEDTFALLPEWCVCVLHVCVCEWFVCVWMMCVCVCVTCVCVWVICVCVNDVRVCVWDVCECE